MGATARKRWIGCAACCAWLSSLACGTDSSLTASSAGLPLDGWQRDPAPLISAGARGEDGLLDTAVADPDVFVDPGTGVWHLWYQTGRARSYTADDSRMVIRLARSTDGGRAWSVAPQIVLTLPDDPEAWDSTHTETPSVVFDPSAPADRRFKLYYSGAAGSHPSGFPAYEIGLAVSADGVTFTRLPAAESPYGRAGLVLRASEALPGVRGLASGVVADPEVLLVGGTYHLWFSSFGAAQDGSFLAFGVSHATSRDGIHWTPDPDNPIPSLRNADNAGGQQPSVAWNPALERFEMWLTSDSDQEVERIPSTFNPTLGLWRAASTDGSSWQVDYGAPRDVYWRPDWPDEQYGLLTGADVLIVGGVRHLFYTGWGSRNVPPGFVVPVRDSPGYAPAVLNLLHATKPAG